jgi:hypothetical protein
MGPKWVLDTKTYIQTARRSQNNFNFNFKILSLKLKEQNMVQSPVGLRLRKNSAGEVQQQL